MRLFGFDITRTRATPQNLSGVSPWWSNYWGSVKESFTGAWQKNVDIVSDKPTLLSSSAVYACVTGIASDIAKMPVNLVRNDKGIREVVNEPHGNSDDSTAISLLRKPNHFQTRLKFIEQWIVSKLLYGNTYVLKERVKGVVTELYILHPLCVTPLVAEDGSVYYQVKKDYLSGVSDERIFPASEIIHDMMVSLWHPLVGVSPLFACALTATMQSKIQNNSTNLFANRSMPGGIVTVPGAIANDTAQRIKDAFESNYGGANIGRVGVLSDGMTFNPITMTAEHSQLIDQLKWTVEDVARAFHYPMFKLAGPYPTYNSIEAINVMYYTDCLQALIEATEASLDRGLGLDGVNVGTEFDVDALWRMDTGAMFDALEKGKNTLTPNEGRRRANLKPVNGGDSVYRQQQDYSLEALAKRDAQEDPFGTAKPEPAAPVTSTQEPVKPEPDTTRSYDAEDLELLYGAAFRKELSLS